MRPGPRQTEWQQGQGVPCPGTDSMPFAGVILNSAGNPTFGL
jgi:hypothetical protein